MTKLTYTLAIINGTVCYECQPSIPGTPSIRAAAGSPRSAPSSTHPQKHRQSITNIQYLFIPYHRKELSK